MDLLLVLLTGAATVTEAVNESVRTEGKTRRVTVV